jgi:hypothetical protein
VGAVSGYLIRDNFFILKNPAGLEVFAVSAKAALSFSFTGNVGGVVAHDLVLQQAFLFQVFLPGEGLIHFLLVHISLLSIKS